MARVDNAPPPYARSGLTKNLHEELVSLVGGAVYSRGNPNFDVRSKLFNGNVESPAQAVVCPVDVQDVSKIVSFCVKNAISLSVKSGGYGIAGWAANGDIIIDMSGFTDMDIEPPQTTASSGYNYTSLRDMPSSGSKGKGRPGKPAEHIFCHAVPPGALNTELPEPMKRGGKRPRQDDVDDATAAENDRKLGLRVYDDASRAVATFLRGPPLPEDGSDEVPRQPPVNRRRIDLGDGQVHYVSEPPAELSSGISPPQIDSRQTSVGSDIGSSDLSNCGRAPSTAATSPSAETTDHHAPPSGTGPDPFSYVFSSTSLAPLTRSPPASSALSGSDPTAQTTHAIRLAPSTTPNFLTGNATGLTPALQSSDPFGYLSTGRDRHDLPVLHAPPSRASAASILNVGPSPPSLLPLASPSPRDEDPFNYMSATPRAAAGSSTVTGDSISSQRINLALPTWMSGANHSHSLPNPVSQAEPIHKHAYVTLGAGVMQKELDIFTAGHPLEARGVGGSPSEVPYHVPSSAHPAGSSMMMLGGFGFLSRLYGLSIDNLVEVEMVLADGNIVIVNENEYPDLWWGIKGSGPALGIITRYKARAFPVPVVFAGNLIYRFHRATAPSLIKHFRDCIKGAPRELYANVLLTAGPANQDSLVVVQICYVGPKEKGQEYLSAISSWDGESCLLNEVSEKAFLDQQDSVAQVLRAKAGRNWFIRSTLINSLPDDIINDTVNQFADTPIGCTWLFELAGGAVADFENTCVPKQQREASFTIAALHQWDMEIDDPRCRDAAEQWIYKTLAPVSTGGPYPSFLGRHEPAERTMACFGANWSDLREIKRKYDPTNVFSNTFWPMTTDGDVVPAEAHEPPSPTAGPE